MFLNFVRFQYWASWRYDCILGKPLPSNLLKLLIFFPLQVLHISWDRSVGIANGYDLHFRVRFPAGAGMFLSSMKSRAALGPTERPMQLMPGSYFPSGKAAGA
jgi:hypothetical protein